MATVDKKTADEVASGKYKSDKAVRIVEYDNAFGSGCSYGVIFKGEDLNRYRASDYVRNPRIYWDLASEGYRKRAPRYAPAPDGEPQMDADKE